MPSDIRKILDRETVVSMIDHVGDKLVQAYVERELIILAGNVNIDSRLNLQNHQVPIVAQELMERFKLESLEDFTLCFRKGRMGSYGEIFRLDGAVIGHWMVQYLEEKYQALEFRLKEEKKNEPKESIIDGSEYIDQMLKNIGEPKRDDNREANEYTIKRLKYNPPSPEEVLKRDLHLQWIRENFDPKTGDKLENWLPENEWLELKAKDNDTGN